MNTHNTPSCAQCSSPLILVSEVTETIEGSHFKQTSRIYRCSSSACQSEIDKETEKRVKLKEKREKIEQERSEKMKAGRTTS